MMDARRLLEEGSDPERALLRAGIDEAPTPESVQSAARVLGLVPRAALVAYGIGLVARAIKASPLGASLVAPVLVVGALAGAYWVTGVHGRSATDLAASHAAAPARVAEPPATPSGVVAVALAPPDLGAAPPIPAPPAVDSNPPPLASTVSRAASKGHAVSSDAVQAQVALVDRARALLASGDASGALRAVDAYEHRFHHGILAEEAALLRIEADAARGDRATAAALAQRFRAEYPRSVHADQIHGLIDGSK